MTRTSKQQNKLPYKKVRVIWQDICSSSQWYDDLNDVDDFTYTWCEDVGYPVSYTHLRAHET